MGYAAINSQENNGLNPGQATMNMSMIINARGTVCLVHDEPFSAIPLWIKYKKNSRVVDILFDNGSSQVAISNVPDKLDSYLINSNRVMIVRIEDQKPVEGWETILLNELN